MAQGSKNAGKKARPTGAGDRVKRFIDALTSLEQDGDESKIVALFTEDCRVSNVQLQTPITGREGAARFWRDYRHTFNSIKSEFSRIIEAGDVAALEWTSRGTLKTGRSIEYRGVSILGFSGDSVADFMAYFDTQVFAAHL